MLEIRNISKSFPGVKALDNVSLSFRPGEIHALVGENGAGKSTLIKIVTGIYQPDEGSVSLDGKPLHFRSYTDSLAAGIGIVHQELQVIPDASVAENIMLDQLDRFANVFGVMNWKKLFAEARRQMERVDLNVRPGALVRDLSVAQKQLVQIAKALALEVKVLLLDEPTSSLTEHEAQRLFAILRNLRDKGVALIFVSHKLDEVFALCDCASVLRDGCLAGSGKIAEMTVQDLVRMMIGRASGDARSERLNPDWDRVVLETRSLSRRGKVRDVSFQLHKGEILGFYGLVGSGRTDLAKLIIGDDREDSGDVFLNGRKVNIRSPERALEVHRIGYVTENRKEEGLFLDDTVRMNTALTVWKRISRFKPLCHIPVAKEHAVARDLVESLMVRTPRLTTPIGSLSGGNQQKACIAKWLAADCEILIIDEPTVGVDIGAKEQIHQIIHDLAGDKGKSVILISSDMPEIVKLANRILVFREGRIVGEVAGMDGSAKTYSQVSEEIGRLLL
jgi:ribose transport system ATP-binding protein